MIVVTSIQVNSSPSSIYLSLNVISAINSNMYAEVYANVDSSIAEIHAQIAEAARDACRANNESIASDATVLIVGGFVQVP